MKSFLKICKIPKISTYKIVWKKKNNNKKANKTNENSKLFFLVFREISYLKLHGYVSDQMRLQKYYEHTVSTSD